MAHAAVSATGVVTGEAVVLDLRPARLGSRSVAFLLDLAAQAAALFLVFLALDALLQSVDDGMATAIVVVLVVVVLVGYPTAAETFWHGRTLGKAAMGIRTVRLDGGTLRFRHAIVRWLVGWVAEFATCLAVLVSLLSPTGRRLGDLAAGTVVVHDRIAVLPTPPIVMPPPLAHWAVAADLSGIDDRLATTVRGLLARASYLHPDARRSTTATLATTVAAHVSPPPPPAPPEHFLHAVIAERARRELSRGQAPYGQAPYGQAPYGQAPYGRPASPGQPPQAPPSPYGQPSYGQPPQPPPSYRPPGEDRPQWGPPA